jgi:uncharacterized protein (DUF1330 family)
MAEAPAAVKAFGGEYLVRGGKHETLEGDWQPHRVAVLRFPSYEQPRPSTTMPLRQIRQLRRRDRVLRHGAGRRRLSATTTI